jgi:hypothetical protein
MALLDITAGWTGPLPFTLKADGLAANLTSMTVALVLKDKNGIAVDTLGDVTVTDQTVGLVTYLPDAADFAHQSSPYAIRFRVTDTSGYVVFFPNGQADQIVVWP